MMEILSNPIALPIKAVSSLKAISSKGCTESHLAASSNICTWCHSGKTFKANIQPDVKPKVWRLLMLFLAYTWNIVMYMPLKNLNRMHAICSLAVTWSFDLAQEGRRMTQTKNLENVTEVGNVWNAINFKGEGRETEQKPRHFCVKEGAMDFFIDNILTLRIWKNETTSALVLDLSDPSLPTNTGGRGEIAQGQHRAQLGFQANLSTDYTRRWEKLLSSVVSVSTL